MRKADLIKFKSGQETLKKVVTKVQLYMPACKDCTLGTVRKDVPLSSRTSKPLYNREGTFNACTIAHIPGNCKISIYSFAPLVNWEYHPWCSKHQLKHFSTLELYLKAINQTTWESHICSQLHCPILRTSDKYFICRVCNSGTSKINLIILLPIPWRVPGFGYILWIMETCHIKSGPL